MEGYGPKFVLIYLDDNFGVCSSRKAALYFSCVVRCDLARAGICEQPIKYVWEPSQKADCMAMTVDFMNFCLILPEGKIESLGGGQRGFERRGLYKDCPEGGQIISFSLLLLGKECLIKTKPLFKFVSDLAQGNKDWDRVAWLSGEARECLLF